MVTNYFFNEANTTFETTDATCQYCHLHKTDTPAANVLLKLFKVKGRTDLLVVRSVKYNAIKVSIARCQACFTIHKQVRLKTRLIVWLAVLAILTACFLLSLYWGVWMGIIGVFAAIFAGVFIFGHIEKKLLAPKGIQNEGAGAKEVDIVVSFLNDGWSMVPPSA